MYWIISHLNQWLILRHIPMKACWKHAHAVSFIPCATYRPPHYEFWTTSKRVLRARIVVMHFTVFHLPNRDQQLHSDVAAVLLAYVTSII
jgi:hypothetical protein